MAQTSPSSSRSTPTLAKFSHVITIAVEKGGAGKTATAVNLAAGLARAGVQRGWRVLLVDLDPQSTAADCLSGKQPAAPEKTLAALLGDDVRSLRPHEFVRPCSWWPGGNLFYIPSTHATLDDIRNVLVNKVAREHRLARVLKPIRPYFNFIVVDTPPDKGVLMQNGLVASDHVIVPTYSDFLGLESIPRTMAILDEIRNGLEQNTPRLLGFVMTFCRANVEQSAEAERRMRGSFKQQVFQSTIPLNSAVPDAFSSGRDAHSYNASSPGARAYDMLTQEVIERVGQN